MLKVVHTVHPAHLGWSVPRCARWCVPVELFEHRVAGLKFLDIHGGVKVSQLHCKVLSMVAGKGRLTATVNSNQEVACCTQRIQDRDRGSYADMGYTYGGAK